MPPTSQPSRPRHAKTPQPAEADSQQPTPADLGELVAAARTGKGEAVERLLAEARPKLLSLAMRVLGNADDAEDAVQDAMIKVWRHIGRFEGRAAFTTWLHRIAINAALDRLRRRGSAHISSAAPEDHAHDSSQVTPPETPERIYARTETAVVVRRAMARLSDTHGEALRLCDLEGESYATIASVTDCPLGTVMSRLFHARRKLARALTETATGEGDLAALRAA
jgi:RNA polymerase sigma-70 factor (ECF subfamily)